MSLAIIREGNMVREVCAFSAQCGRWTKSNYMMIFLENRPHATRLYRYSEWEILTDMLDEAMMDFTEFMAAIALSIEIMKEECYYNIVM